MERYELTDGSGVITVYGNGDVEATGSARQTARAWFDEAFGASNVPPPDRAEVLRTIRMDETIPEDAADALTDLVWAAFETDDEEPAVDWAARVAAAADLDELCEVLNDLHEAKRQAEEVGDTFTDPIDYAGLPTFGGEAPDDTAGVWSWDAERILVGAGDWEIVAREDYDG